ncbi:hypothetical protein AB0E10_02040 [Streptomyces sp. NPDC048045]|uniref:hypothetical protein n=1 Tax=Streptomyces sp. NPDC048045 TaxID=3154710 RepID=UPI00344238D3
MAGVFTWIRQWWAGSGAGPGTPVAGPAGSPSGSAAEASGSAGEASRSAGEASRSAGEASGHAGEEIPGEAAEPAPGPGAPQPGGGTRGGTDIAPPREVLPERPPTLYDLVLFLMNTVLGSTRALFRFLAVLVVVGMLWVRPHVPVGIHALAHRISPGSFPSLGAVNVSMWLLGGVGALVIAGRRIRSGRRNRPQDPPTPTAGTARPPEPGPPAAEPEPEPPAAESDAQQP